MLEKDSEKKAKITTPSSVILSLENYRGGQKLIESIFYAPY